MQRHGFTLIEITISLAITSLVMVAVSQAISATRNLEGLQDAEDELTFDATRIQRAIVSDLSQSAWHIVPIGTVDGSAFTVTPPSALPSDPAADRALQYWPYVLTQRTLATQFPLMKRSSSMVNLTLPAALLPGSASDSAANNFFLNAANQAEIGALDPAAAGSARQAKVDVVRRAFYASWYAPSQELIFLKQIGDDGWNANPSPKDLPAISFPRTIKNQPDVSIDWSDTSDTNRALLGILYPTPYVMTSTGANQGTYVYRTNLTSLYGLPLRATVLDQSDSSKLTFRTSWQTIAAPTYDMIDMVVSSATPDNALRQFVYAVVPGGASTSGFGRLVRAYKTTLSSHSSARTGSNIGQMIASDSTYCLIVDDILSENCVRVVFDTARTDVGLAINEVRARIYLVRRSSADPTVLIRQVVDMHATMRSRNSFTDRTINDTPIFAPSSGVPGYVY